MTVPTPHHDIVIVGGGAAGLGAARAARWADADVAIISDAPLGGDCTFTGCVPSKTLLAAARAGQDFETAMKRVSETVESIAAAETAAVLRAEGVTVYEGRAGFTGSNQVEVDGRTIGGEALFVATGSRPVVPPIAGVDSISVLTNETIWGLTEQPRVLGIVGAGPIGCEMAQAFSQLGSEVVLIEAADRILGRDDPEAAAVVAAALAANGVQILVNEQVTALAQEATSTRITTTTADLVVDRVFVAVGRRANGAGLGLEDLGVEVDGGGRVNTDDRLRTAVESIFAIGDVTGKFPFTHGADAMGRLAVGNALKSGPRGRFRPGPIPWVTFTDPELAHVGLTEAEASGRGVKVAYLPMTEVDRAITDQRTEGFIKLIAGPKPISRGLYGGQVLGATIVGPRAGEMIHEAALAMRSGMFTGRLAQTVHAYPTWSSGIQQAAAQFFGSVNGRTAQPARR